MNFTDRKKGAPVLLTALFIVLSGSPAFAQSDNKTVEQRLNQIEQQLESNNWYKSITISGAIEVETNYVDGPDDSSSDITLATAEFAIEAAVTEGITANLLFLFEENATDSPELDEGFINVQLGETPFSVTTGQFYLPFGIFESALLSDPLTLELGETRESALQLNYEQAHFHGAVFLFNGSTEEKIDSYGASAGFSHEGHRYALDINLAFISNIADSNTLQDGITDSDAMNSTIAGTTAQITFSMGAITLSGEYLGANEHFEAADLSFKNEGAQPSSSNFEIVYDFDIRGRNATIALAIQSTDEALVLGLPQQRTAIALSVDILENTSITAELKHDEDYSKPQGGTGNNTNTSTLQLAVSF